MRSATSYAGDEFRRSNYFRRPLSSAFFTQHPPHSHNRSMTSSEACGNGTGIPHPNLRSHKKAPYIDYSSLTRILKRTRNLPMVPKKLSLQQCASVLLPVAFTALLIVICVVTALALLTDGFTLCPCRRGDRTGSSADDFANQTDGVCLTNECIRKAYYLIDRIDRATDVCANFYRFTCGRFRRDAVDAPAGFEDELKAKFEQKPRPSFPLPARMLFDFYDSCTAEEHQDQLGTQPFAAFVFRLQGTQPFAAFVSRLGGWSLLQNAKFDGANFAWESLEQQLAGYDLPALLSITIEAPAFLLATYRRQLLDDYFTRLLEELEVDAALAQEAVQEALDFESALIGTTPDVAAESEKMRLSELKERYNKIDWTRVFGQSADERKEADVQVQVDVAHLDRLLMQLDKGKSPIGNYMMLRTLHSLVAHLPRRFRAHHERLDERYEPRWRTCVREMGELLAAPLYAFSFQQLESLDYSKLSGTISRSKEQVAKQLRQSQWLDGETQQRLLQNVHNLRVITNLLNGPQAAEQVRAAFEGARLDRSSYFDNVLLLKQTNSRASGRGILGAYDWHALLTNPSPVVNAENKEMIYGPVSIRALTQAPQLVQTMIVRRHLLEYLFNPAAVSGWKAESRSILNAKFNCFERGLAIRPHQQIYDQMALQAADERGADDDLRLPGLTEFNSQQLLFIAFGASACNNDQSTKSASEKSINHILQNLDGFAEAFDCPIGTPMNPRDKCSVL